jgi:hypothetical protein
MARSRTTTLGDFEITRRPNAHGSNLVDKEQPTIIVSGPGTFEFMGRWTLLCGVPDGSGGKTSVKATEATDEQIIFALTHDESIYA